MKIAEIRSTIDSLNWARQNFTGGTRDENMRTDLAGVLQPHIDAVEALDIKPRFKDDIARRDDALAFAKQALDRWKANRQSVTDARNSRTALTQDIQTVPVMFDIYATAKFAQLNKNDTLTEYKEEVAAGRYRTERIKVVEIATVTAQQYDELSKTLLSSRKWLDGKGGTNSSWEAPEGIEHIWQLSEEQAKQWRDGAYALCIAVQCADRPTFYINPEGYDYARYVGI